MSSSEAARMLFDQSGDEVYRYIRFTVGSEADAEDILQDVFLRVLQSWSHFNHRSSPKTWLWSIANNCLREYFRKQRRSHGIVPYERDIEDSTQADRTLFLELERSLDCLTIPQRQVFVERIIHEKSSTETSEALGWSEAKVRTTLHRAIKNIRTWFTKEEELK
jgi:RNA polymerase sigma-70 factor (ECF subfamily)